MGKFFRDQYGDIRAGRVLAIATALVFAATIGWCYFLNNYEYSSGSRAGVVNKISKKGLIWKTYESQIALEGIVSGDTGVGANIWDFSLDNQARHGENIEEIAKKLSEALESGQKFKVKYIQVLGGWPWRGSTGHYAQSVEPIGKK